MAYLAAVRGELEPAPLPNVQEDEPRPDGKGGYLVAIDHQTLDRIKGMRRPGERYSDVIARLANANVQADL
jgi:hypothetical protein